MRPEVCTVPGVADSVAEVRGWVGEVLRAAGFRDRLVENSVAVVSELVTNAVKYTNSARPGGTVRVELQIGTRRVRLSVIDAGTESCEPIVPRCCPDPDVAEAPRGLYLTDQWAQRIAVHGDERGRIVAADLAADAGPEQSGSPTPQPLPRRVPPSAAGSGGNGCGGTP